VTAAARFVQLREPPLSVHVHELGSGDPVLFIHGGNSVAIGWLPLLTRLQSRFRLIVPDRPGCGLTSQFSYLGVDLRAHGAAFVGGVLEALDLPRAALIGNSMGGFFATSFALAHPERVSKLVLIGEPAGSAKMPVAFHRLVGTRGLNTLIYSTALRPPRGAADMRKSLARGHLVADPSRVPDPLLECLSEGARLPGAVQSWMTMVERAFEPAGAGLFARRVKLTYALRPELPRLAVPTLFLWGDRDPLGPPTLGGEMAALMPHGKLEVVSDAGHLPWLDQPDFCADRIASFLAAG
ncbi:MAG TPA: alpha/beta hydrolase, partial [Polyangia bacterium]